MASKWPRQALRSPMRHYPYQRTRDGSQMKSSDQPHKVLAVAVAITCLGLEAGCNKNDRVQEGSTPEMTHTAQQVTGVARGGSSERQMSQSAHSQSTNIA